MLKCLQFTVLAAALVVFAGCNDYRSTPNVTQLSGRVTLDGQPLGQAKILFVPLRQFDEKELPSSVSFAITDQNGKFSLQLDGGGLGVVVGEHRVFVATGHTPTEEETFVAPEFRLPTREEAVPARYNRETELFYLVPPGGGDDAVFDLVTDA